jgi:hypothetical protein
MFPKRFAQAIFVTVMVVIMSFVMSLAMTLVNYGPRTGFLFVWTRSWLIAAIIAWPTAYLAVPVARRMVARLTR